MDLFGLTELMFGAFWRREQYPAKKKCVSTEPILFVLKKNRLEPLREEVFGYFLSKEQHENTGEHLLANLNEAEITPETKY